MGAESLAGGAVLIGLGVPVGVVGWLGVRRRITYALGGWTRDTATPESWDRAHRRIGLAFMVAGGVAIVAGVVAFVAPADRVGPVVVVGSAAMLVPTVVGVVRGVGRLEQR